MPAFAGPLVGLSLGALLARWGKGAGSFRSAVPLLAFGVIVLAPACAYPLLFFSDWAIAYLLDSRSIPSAVTLALLLIDAASPAVGFVLARRVLVREALGEDRAAHSIGLALAIVPAGIAGLISVFFAPRLATVGTYAMVRGDFGTAPLWRSPLGLALVWISACIGAGAWLTWRSLVAVGAEAKSAPSVPASENPEKARPTTPKPYLGGRRPR